MRRFFTAFLLLVQLTGFAQIDQKKLDSLSKAIESSAKAFQAWQDSFDKVQDSIYQSSVRLGLEQNNRNLDNFLAEQKRREEKQRQQAMIRFAVSGVIFAVLIVVLIRKRKQKT